MSVVTTLWLVLKFWPVCHPSLYVSTTHKYSGQMLLFLATFSYFLVTAYIMSTGNSFPYKTSVGDGPSEILCYEKLAKLSSNVWHLLLSIQ